MADLSSTVANFATGTYTVTRADGPGSHVDGVFTPASSSTLAVLAAVFPLAGRELQRLPEGRRTGDVREMFTTVALRVSAPEQAADLVEVDGASFEVEVVEDWNAAGRFYRSLIRKVGV